MRSLSQNPEVTILITEINKYQPFKQVEKDVDIIAFQESSHPKLLKGDLDGCDKKK